jgi:ferredoxin like protein
MAYSDLPKANVEQKLGYLTYKADHEHSHISIPDATICADKCQDKPCLTGCPAQVYTWEEVQKKTIVSYENCIECGACRMLCPFDNIKCHWPRGGFGVQYKWG